MSDNKSLGLPTDVITRLSFGKTSIRNEKEAESYVNLRPELRVFINHLIYAFEQAKKAAVEKALTDYRNYDQYL